MLEEIRRLFYPHSSNNYKASLLQPSGLCLLIAIFLLTQSFLNLSFGLAPGVLGFASQITPEEIIELTNKRRTERGIAPLKVEEKLNEAARQKAADMFALDYWSHVSPRGVVPWSFILNVGYQYLYAGENLARDFAHSEGVVNAWMNSPTHQANILNDKYQDIGVAVVDGVLQGQETTVVVQFFGTSQKKLATIPEGGVKAASEQEEEEVVPPVLTTFKPEEKEGSRLSGFDLTRSLGLAFAGLLFGVLALDGFVIWRRKKVRIAGHNFIHGTFVIILIIMILLSQQGIIL